MTVLMPSPCVGLCEIPDDGLYCRGCARTRDEIDGWGDLGAEEKSRIFEALVQRRKETGFGVPVLGLPMATLDRLFLESLDDPKARWSIGVPGANATFCPSEGNVAISPRLWEYGGYAVGAYGGIRVVLDHRGKKIKAIGTTDPETGSLSRIDLCLYENRAFMSRRTVLTEIGWDTEALRVRDRPSILFDLGLGISHIDYCIRVEDDETIRELRACAGRSVFEPDSPVPALLQERTRSQRVLLTRLGRIEIWGALGEPGLGDSVCTGEFFDLKLFQPDVDRVSDSPVPPTLKPVISLRPGRRVGLF
ncbi:DUF1289 domain-containing protein [Phaeovibrio sulfidiphilus]|uniref:DUF1289 domain-containing protein n=1 Tax=Phaeovibrio sulfidiphilus TaxID=1220600 RepID=A0A8J6YMC7_9PROT|nr:DUF1289 domain-containing protein [Phaeovibrio sulfidiphilus]MBE1237070.1 DUF1289 domain-containing protein [Phaeovibrio sulfidiphilus]